MRGQSFDARHHARQSVAAAHAEVLIQIQTLEQTLDVERQNTRRGLPGVNLAENGDETFDQRRIAVRHKVNDFFAALLLRISRLRRGVRQ